MTKFAALLCILGAAGISATFANIIINLIHDPSSFHTNIGNYILGLLRSVGMLWLGLLRELYVTSRYQGGACTIAGAICVYLGVWLLIEITFIMNLEPADFFDLAGAAYCAAFINLGYCLLIIGHRLHLKRQHS